MLSNADVYINLKHPTQCYSKGILVRNDNYSLTVTDFGSDVLSFQNCSKRVHEINYRKGCDSVIVYMQTNIIIDKLTMGNIRYRVFVC